MESKKQFIQRREITDMKKKTRRNASHENSDAKASQKKNAKWAF
jgi:hypothetical protein